MKHNVKPANYNTLLVRIGEIPNLARTKVAREINKAQVLAYWEIGREIVEFEQKGKIRAEYGEELIKRLSKDMTEMFGRGFSEINIRNMRRFYLEFTTQIQQTPSAKFEPMLSWPHYCELSEIEEPFARSFFEKGAIRCNWSVQGLRKKTNERDAETKFSMTAPVFMCHSEFISESKERI